MLSVRHCTLLGAVLALAPLPLLPCVSASASAQAAAATTAATHGELPTGKRIDINHATQAELLKIPGMTPVWAGRIVRFRPYRTRRNLLDRGVLPDSVYDRIKDCIVAHRDLR